MITFFHFSFRVKDPERAAALYADLLDGRVRNIGPPLDEIGVRAVFFGRNDADILPDHLELWPAGKQWVAGRMADVDPGAASFGHFAVGSDKTPKEIAAITAKHGATMLLEERGKPYPVPVVYDHDGNFLEMFRRT